MGLYKRGGDTWWNKFRYNGKTFRFTTKTKNLQAARQIAAAQRTETIQKNGGTVVMPQPNNKSTHVYVVTDGEAHKIGICGDRWTERLASLQVGSSKKLSLVDIWKVKQPVVVERELHLKFEHLRIHGEWFALSEDNLREIKEHMAVPRRVPRKRKIAQSCAPIFPQQNQEIAEISAEIPVTS